MKNPQLSKLVQDQIVADSTTATTGLTSEFLLAAGAAQLVAAFEQRALTGSWNGAARIRYAAVSTQRPGAWGTPSTPKATANVFGATFDTSGTTDQMWVQVGFVGNASSGVAECLGRLQAAVAGNGMLLASQTVEVTPDTNTPAYTFVALGKAFALPGLTKVMMGITFSGVTGSIVWRPVIRPIVGNVEFPGAWADLGAGDTTTTADGDVNTGQLTYAAPTDTLLGQVGIKYQGTARGTLKILVAGIF